MFSELVSWVVEFSLFFVYDIVSTNSTTQPFSLDNDAPHKLSTWATNLIYMIPIQSLQSSIFIFWCVIHSELSSWLASKCSANPRGFDALKLFYLSKNYFNFDSTFRQPLLKNILGSKVHCKYKLFCHYFSHRLSYWREWEFNKTTDSGYHTVLEVRLGPFSFYFYILRLKNICICLDSTPNILSYICYIYIQLIIIFLILLRRKDNS